MHCAIFTRDFNTLTVTQHSGIPVIIQGDCLEVLKTLPENSVDALVTDPPYGWRFMGKAWDGADIIKTIESKHAGKREGLAQSAGFYDQSLTGNQAFQEWTRQWAAEVFRVLKPGAHALIFCGPRTYHRMASGVEDAGFEIRDQLQWIFGSGFPKSHDVSKAIDKAAGAKRIDLGPNPSRVGRTQDIRGKGLAHGSGNEKVDASALTRLTAPATDAAKQWQGFGTALKPANEPILLARKPLSEKTVAANVLKWGTGALNIDASRIEASKDYGRSAKNAKGTVNAHDGFEGKSFKIAERDGEYASALGRFPANLLLSHSPHCEEDQCDIECAVAMLDAQSGKLHGHGSKTHSTGGTKGLFFEGSQGQMLIQNGDDSGGASRFFYCAKVSTSERNAGLEGEGKVTTDGRTKPIDNPFLRGETVRLNGHPCVKPQKLMRYLCKLITPPGGTVLDPFLGSGSTGLAAKSEGFGFIGIEREPEYIEIAKARIG